MNLAKIKLMGLRAFELGLSSAPALNQAFVVALTEEFKKVANIKERAKAAKFMANAYVSGWTIAHLAKDAPEDMPSVKMYKAIIDNPEAYL